MKFLVDECIGPTVTLWLRKSGYDAISIYDTIPGSPDTVVLRKAASEHRILITSDKDFGDMVFRKHRKHYGIILLRLTDE